MSDRQERIDAYVATWNEPRLDQRQTLIETAWDEDGKYLAPAVEAKGYNEINDNIVRIQEKYPNRVFCRTSDIFEHKDRVRYSWAMLDLAGSATIAGVDYAVFGPNGRLRRVICVYDRKPRADELN